MAPTRKKGSKSTKARPLRPARQTLVAKQAQTIAELRQELAQSVQRENATARELRRPDSPRRWSIRRQPPRCSASSAARRRTCSRSSTPSSRARPGFVGSMTWCCDSTRATMSVPRAHFGPIPYSRDLEISVDEPQFRWMREHGALHIPDVRAQNEFPVGDFRHLPHLLSRSPSSAGRTYWNTGRTSYRGAPFHPGADQASRNLRRPGSDRDRERSDVPRTQGVVGAADRDQRNLGRHR